MKKILIISMLSHLCINDVTQATHFMLPKAQELEKRLLQNNLYDYITQTQLVSDLAEKMLTTKQIFTCINRALYTYEKTYLSNGLQLIPEHSPILRTAESKRILLIGALFPGEHALHKACEQLNQNNLQDRNV